MRWVYFTVSKLINDINAVDPEQTNTPNLILATMNLGFTDTPTQTAAYLRTLPAIRERCGRVHDLAIKGKLDYFDYHPQKEAEVSSFCIGIMKVGGMPLTARIFGLPYGSTIERLWRKLYQCM